MQGRPPERKASAVKHNLETGGANDAAAKSNNSAISDRATEWKASRLERHLKGTLHTCRRTQLAKLFDKVKVTTHVADVNCLLREDEGCKKKREIATNSARSKHGSLHNNLGCPRKTINL